MPNCRARDWSRNGYRNRRNNGFNGQSYRRDILGSSKLVTKDIEMEVQAEIMIDPGKGLETIQEIGINIMIEAKAEVEIGGKGLELPQE